MNDHIAVASVPLELRSEVIVSATANHLNRISEPRNGDCLVSSLASGMNLEICSEDRFPYCRNSVADCDQVDVDAAHDDDWPLFRHGPLDAKLTCLWQLNDAANAGSRGDSTA